MRRLRKSLRPQNHWKFVTYFTLMIVILILYVNELKWLINSKWAALGRALLNVLLASGVKVYRLHSYWRRTFWVHAVIKIVWCSTFDFVRDNNCYSSLSHVWINCCKQPNYNFCTSQGSVATALTWVGLNYSHLRKVSFWCCLPKIAKINQCLTEFIKKISGLVFWDTV